MRHRKSGARLLGLVVVAALGVMAFAASAQAVAPGFLINKKPVGSLLALVTGKIEAGTVGTIKVAGLNFELNCTSFTTHEGHISSNTHAKAVLLYTGCSTLSLSALTEMDCHVQEPVTAEALLLPAETTAGGPAILAESIKALVTLHLKGTPVLKEKPCIWPLDNTITGTACFEITPATNDTKLPLLIAGAICSGSVDELKYGSQTATLEGKAELLLTGPHHGTPLGVSLY
jgi:hypothetical protein